MRLSILLIVFLVIVSVLILLGEIYFPPISFGFERIFSVEKGQSFWEVAKNLEKEDLIPNKISFSVYLIITRNYKKIQAGKYLLSPSMTIPQIVKKLIAGEIAGAKLTIPEGFTIKQIENQLVEKKLPINSGLSKRKAGLYKEEFEFLKDVSDTITLEGFLFPDTYYFSYEESLDDILRKMLENFGEKLTEDLRNEALKQGKSILEIVTMASMIEKEVRTLEDKKLVSGILWKRLENNMQLQVDATIIYITGKKTVKVTLEDLKIDSPYNTYKYKGLPAGPICNSGLESIQAAVYPEENEYWFYLSTPEGETIFSKTLEEHQIARDKYLKNQN